MYFFVPCLLRDSENEEYHLKLEAETLLKIDSYDNFLPFFLVPNSSTSD